MLEGVSWGIQHRREDIRSAPTPPQVTLRGPKRHYYYPTVAQSLPTTEQRSQYRGSSQTATMQLESARSGDSIAAWDLHLGAEGWRERATGRHSGLLRRQGRTGVRGSGRTYSSSNQSSGAGCSARMLSFIPAHTGGHHSSASRPKNRNKGVGAVTRNECLQRARASCGSKKLCTPRADDASVLLREVVFEKRAFKLHF